MNIKKTTMNELDEVMEIYAYAREQMKVTGNPTQWGNTDPKREKIERDINNGDSYIIEEDGNIYGVFSFIIGEDETYQVIEGKWLNNEPYGTIHSVASSGKIKGILDLCLKFCEERQDNVRIDTHENNKIMQHLIEKNGYTKCGIIYVEDGSPRIAYHKCLK